MKSTRDAASHSFRAFGGAGACRRACRAAGLAARPTRARRSTRPSRPPTHSSRRRRPTTFRRCSRSSGPRARTSSPRATRSATRTTSRSSPRRRARRWKSRYDIADPKRAILIVGQRRLAPARADRRKEREVALRLEGGPPGDPGAADRGQRARRDRAPARLRRGAVGVRLGARTTEAGCASTRRSG